MKKSQTLLLASFILVAGLAACRNDAESPSTSPQTGTTTAAVTANAAALVFRQVSAGGSHTCGVTTGDRAYCWGDNSRGQLGDGTTTRRLRPVAVVGGLRFKQLSAGSDDTCGTTTDNQLYCWGYDYLGEFGQDGATGLNPTPTRLPDTIAWRDVSLPTARLDSLGEHTCAITLDKLAYCWGDNGFGDLGIGPFHGGGVVQTPFPVVGDHHFQQVTTGIDHTCGITLADQLFCWGLNFSGELGVGARDPLPVEHNTPLRVKASGLLFRQVSAGGDHYTDPIENFNAPRGYTCAVTTEDTAYCWGDNKFGQLGDNGTHDLTIPHPVAGGHHFRQVSAGPLHACAITTQNKAYCWGRNKFGDLGDGTDAFRQRHPVLVVGGLQFSSVTAGDVHTCALTPSGAAYCWGNNQYGQLGIGVTGTRTTPVPVRGP